MFVYQLWITLDSIESNLKQRLKFEMSDDAQLAEDIKYLEDNLTKYPDFPKTGILFR